MVRGLPCWLGQDVGVATGDIGTNEVPVGERASGDEHCFLPVAVTWLSRCASGGASGRATRRPPPRVDVEILLPAHLVHGPPMPFPTVSTHSTRRPWAIHTASICSPTPASSLSACCWPRSLGSSARSRTLNVAMTISPILSALAMFMLLRRWVSWAPAAFFGGLLYGFSPFILTSPPNSWLTLGMGVVPPLVIICLDNLLLRQRGRPVVDGLLLGLAQVLPQ